MKPTKLSTAKLKLATTKLSTVKLTKKQQLLKNEIVSEFLKDFLSLDEIIDSKNISLNDEIVVITSIYDDFMSECN